MMNRFFIITILFTSFIGGSVAGEYQFPHATANLTAIFRQMGKSLEVTGSPEAYFRHVKSEHDRVAASFGSTLNRPMPSLLPEYFTSEYLDDSFQIWSELSPKLKLEKLSIESGKLIQLAIDGPDGDGTSLILFFNDFQERIYRGMTSQGSVGVNYEDLAADLIEFAREGESPFLARREDRLSKAEQVKFQDLIEKSRFTKSDFDSLESFYAGPYDRLSDSGKGLLSQRVFAGQKGEDVQKSEAAIHAAALIQEFDVLFGKLEDQLPEETSSDLISWLSQISDEITFLAVAEYKIAMREQALNLD